MRILAIAIFVLICQNLLAQKKVEDFGYVHHMMEFQSDTVEFIVRSRKGDEQKKKPVLIFIQGSLAKPLIKYSENGAHYSPFPFNEQIFSEKFHLISINKPGIPVIMEKYKLAKNGEYIDTATNFPPKEYTEKANLTYYTERNSIIVDHLIKQSWVDPDIIVVAGHSEGASIAVKMASANKNITHLIYSGGTPYYSRILSMIMQDRKAESSENSWVELDFDYWAQVNEKPFDVSREHGFNANKGTFTFSQKLNNDFKRLTIPVLVSYGTKDPACPFNDLLRVEMMQENKTNINFRSYLNREHNFFEVSEDGKINYDNFGWDLVGEDWLKWINEK